jgi:hypothetical protein
LVSSAGAVLLQALLKIGASATASFVVAGSLVTLYVAVATWIGKF